LRSQIKDRSFSESNFLSFLVRWYVEFPYLSPSYFSGACTDL
jgi:hypothetical protein